MLRILLPRLLTLGHLRPLMSHFVMLGEQRGCYPSTSFLLRSMLLMFGVDNLVRKLLLLLGIDNLLILMLVIFLPRILPLGPHIPLFVDVGHLILGIFVLEMFLLMLGMLLPRQLLHI
ncbi:hypothetical protein Pyn_00571 [Prunus yedoensis var. nudiflora]|uniref:Uncharacterized protein n=1 Tax=Prunus yedoensis var. nudiflora TaxID=2094558 RepID=A0A314UDY3_PRUYE|nr:hypothetical protein Pyn_00571 [Prunus yedoensis var. nudiflora]